MSGMSDQAVAWIEARGLDPELASKLGQIRSKMTVGGNVERLFAKLRVSSSGCWEFTGRRMTKNGYGLARGTTAHRAVYKLFCDIPEGLVLDHRCRNRRCCNPLHLDPVTQQTNVLRGIGLAAENKRKIRCRHGHPFEGANVRLNSKGQRICRECHRRRELARYHRKNGVDRAV